MNLNDLNRLRKKHVTNMWPRMVLINVHTTHYIRELEQGPVPVMGVMFLAELLTLPKGRSKSHHVNDLHIMFTMILQADEHGLLRKFCPSLQHGRDSAGDIVL